MKYKKIRLRLLSNVIKEGLIQPKYKEINFRTKRDIE